MMKNGRKRELKTYKGRPVKRQEPLPSGTGCLLIYVSSRPGQTADREIVTAEEWQKHGRRQFLLPREMPDIRQLAATFE